MDRSDRLTLFLAAAMYVTGILCAAVGAGGCGGAASSGRRGRPLVDLTVIDFTVDAEAGSPAPIFIRFSRPVVDEERVGVRLSQLPLTAKPPFSTSGRWTDRQTLVVTPTERLRPATRYAIELLGELREARLPRALTFVHHPLRLERISELDRGQVPPRPTFKLHFNQPVSPTAVEAGCHLVRGDLGHEPVKLRALDRGRSRDVVSVTVDEPLDQGVNYSFGCKDLVARPGAVPMEEPFALILVTYAPFRLVSRTPDELEGANRVYPDRLRLALAFSTPVPLPALKRALQVTPSVEGIDQGWLDRGNTRYTVELKLAPRTRYEVRLDPELTDAYGQKLEAPVRFTLATRDARPALSLQTGIYTLEPVKKGYPVWSRNLSQLDVECAAVAADKVVKLLTSSLDYDPWYDAASDVIAWKDLGLTRRRHRLALGRKPNAWQLTHLALHRLCTSGDKTARKGRGLFLAQLGSEQLVMDPQRRWAFRPRKRVLANVTDLGLLLKAGRASGVLWVTRLSTGDPVGGARVTIYRPDGKRVHRGVTDPRGIAILPGTAKLAKGSGQDAAQDPYAHARRQRLIAIVEHSGDMALVDGNWANGIQLWNFGVPVDRSGALARLRTFIQSDRGIYRPGETARLKGLVREVSAGRPPRLPKTKTVVVQVVDSRDTTLHEETIRLSPFGGFALAVPIDSGAPTGDYTVNVRIDGQTFREQFIVEAFRPASFELKTAGLERHQRLGDKVAVRFTARYLFGAPVSNAKVRWRVQRRPHLLRFPRFVGYVFADHAAQGRFAWWNDLERHRSLENVADGETRADGAGAFAVDITSSRSEGPLGPGDSDKRLSGAHDYLVHAAVTDEADQTINKHLVLTAHESELYLGLHSQEYVQAVGMPFSVNTVALAPDGKQVAARATLSLIRERYVCQHEGRYRSSRRCEIKHEPVWQRPVSIPRTGNGTERLLPEQPGEYVIRLAGVDGRGNKLAASTHVWVLGKGEAFWSGDESVRMSVIASKEIYEPGEIARLVPRANLKNPTALVTLERDGVIEAHVFKLKSTAEGLRLPILPGHAPNIFASVALVSGRQGQGDRQRPQFKMGVVELKVKSDAQRLDVKVLTDRTTYEPGERVQGTIRVSSAGRPVRAEVALSAADEGVLQLIAYRTPDPMRTMYKAWGLGVDSSTTWNRIARLAAPDGADTEEGGDSAGPGADRVRSRFVSSAFWDPMLRTGAEGTVRFSFVAPDNLTAFRLMAVAADRGSRFGSADSRITVRKALLAQPIAPRFFRAGDKVRIGVLVRNDTGRSGTVSVSASAQGLHLAHRSKDVQLKTGQTRRVLFDGSVTAGKQATLRFAVALADHRDTVTIALPIHRPRTIDNRLLSRGVLEGNDEVHVALDWDDTLLPEESTLTVSVDRTGLSELEGALSYLVGYPYGCLEQTLSRFIPLVKVRDLVRSLELKQLPRRSIDRFVAAGVAKVIRHQTADGDFSLWPGAPTEPHLTVYALWGLDEARRAGVRVDSKVFERGVAALKRWIDGPGLQGGAGDDATVAMAAYLLARLGQPNSGVNAWLFDVHRGLPAYGLAFLLRAMALAKAPAEQLAALQRALLVRVKIVGPRATVQESGSKLARYMSSDVRSAAMVLSALLEVQPDHSGVPKLAAGLLESQAQLGRWENTQDNLYALVALADYARQQSRGKSQVEIWLTPARGVAGERKRLVRRTIHGGAVVSLGRPLSALKRGTLTIKGKGRLRYRVRLTSVRRDSANRAVSRGLSIERQYLDPQSGAPVSQLAPGQLVKVRLAVQTDEPRHYVALVDPLPAGLEAVNAKLATARVEAPADQATPSWYRGYLGRNLWSHQELRDDRVLAFADAMAPGQTHVFEYLARATLAGQFYAAAARVEQMYRPENHGRSSGQLLVVAEASAEQTKKPDSAPEPPQKAAP